jgi:hypothetical protein
VSAATPRTGPLPLSGLLLGYADDEDDSQPAPPSAFDAECARKQQTLQSCVEAVLRAATANPAAVARLHFEPPRRPFRAPLDVTDGVLTLDLAPLQRFRMLQFVNALETELRRRRECITLTHAALETRRSKVLQVRWLPAVPTRFLGPDAPKQDSAEKEAGTTGPAKKRPAEQDRPTRKKRGAAELAVLEAVAPLRVPIGAEEATIRQVTALHALFGCEDKDAEVERPDHATLRMRVPSPSILSLDDWKRAADTVRGHCGPDADLYFCPAQGAVFVEWVFS